MINNSSSLGSLLAWTLAGFILTLVLWDLSVGGLSSSSTHNVDTLAPHDAAVRQEHGMTGQSWTGWDSIEDIMVFGDGSTSTRYDPQGKRPTLEEPFGNEGYLNRKKGQTGQIRGEGPKWIEFLAKQYNKTTVRVTNFATPNSTVDKFFWAPRPMGKGPGTGRNSFKDEITVFQGSYSALDLKPYNEWNPATTLFVAWFGLNEAMQSVIRDRRIPMDAVFAAYRASLERLYRIGARNFLLLNVPPMQTITHKYYKGNEYLVADIEDFNNHINEMYARMAYRHPEGTYFLFDVHKLWWRALEQPESFPITADLKNLHEFCDGYAKGSLDLSYHDPTCSHPRDQYFWLNNRHPTHVVHNLTAATLAENCFGDGAPSEYCSLAVPLNAPTQQKPFTV